MNRRCAAMVLAVLLLPAGCATYAESMRDFRWAWEEGDFSRAHAGIDQRLADEADLPNAAFASAKSLANSVDSAHGETGLLLLEKSVLLMASGDTQGALELLRIGRDQLDANLCTNFGQYAAAIATDDTMLAYAGADYEHIMVRVMLALCDILSRTGDEYAYTLQIGEKQEALLASDLGEKQGYKPREHYRRVAIGAYLQGILLEARHAPDEAKLVYSRMLEYDPGLDIGKEALARVDGGRYAERGNGVLHVFYLGGSGPHLEQGFSPPTDAALQIAAIFAAVSTGSLAPLAQTNVPVPIVAMRDTRIAPLEVRTGNMLAHTQLLLDVNEVAHEQMEAMMPMIIARALIRRVAKAAVASGMEKAGKDMDSDGGTLLQVMAIIGHLFATAAERADTRNWSTLPAQIQTARMEMPAGDHKVELGPDMRTNVHVRAGRESYIVVIQPNAARPGAVLVDRYSRR